MIIQLSEYYFNKCANFADRQLETSFDCYAYRGEIHKHKMREDIIYGKLGEIAAYKYLNSKGYDVNKPDFIIYEKASKSFAADMVSKCGLNIHVKSQGFDSMMRYGASWLLQKSDSIVKNPSKDDIILMVSVKGLEADVLGTVSVKSLYDKKLFETPKVYRYARTKVALYFNNIKNSGISLGVL